MKKVICGIISRIKNDSVNNEQGKDDASYKITYSKAFKKRVKLFCIENEGITIKDVFMRGAEMFMEGYGK